MKYFSSGDVSDVQFPIGVLRRLSDASPTGALREGVFVILIYQSCSFAFSSLYTVIFQ